MWHVSRVNTNHVLGTAAGPEPQQISVSDEQVNKMLLHPGKAETHDHTVTWFLLGIKALLMKRQDETELPEDSDLVDTEYFEVSYIFHSIRSSTQLVCRSDFPLPFSHYDGVFTLYGTLPPSKFFPNLSLLAFWVLSTVSAFGLHRTVSVYGYTWLFIL